jgi:hypothetical protein
MLFGLAPSLDPAINSSISFIWWKRCRLVSVVVSQNPKAGSKVGAKIKIRPRSLAVIRQI